MSRPTSLFGRIAVKKGLASPAQLERALRLQEEIDALGLHKPLGQILVADGILAEGQVDVILRLQRLNQRAGEARRFGRVALRNGFIDQSQLQAALSVAGDEGYQRPLSLILEAQGALEPRITRAIDQALARHAAQEQLPEQEQPEPPRGITGRLSRTLDLAGVDEEDEGGDEEDEALEREIDDMGFAAVAFREGLIQVPELERALSERARSPGVSLAQVFLSRGVLSPHDVEQVARGLNAARQEKLTVPGYEWVDVLGYGVTSIVLKARHAVLDREVAIKLFREEHIQATSADALVEEAKAVARLHHRNVVELYEVGRVRRRIYFVMELVEGPTLLDVIREQGPVPEHRALRMACDVARALSAIHAQGLVHRDVKPQNILISGERVKLTDLGLVCEQGQATEDFAVFGSPYTMSPEQANGEPVDERADLYGLGATLYYALTEEPPYGGQDTLGIMMAHMTAPIPDPRARIPGLSAGTAELVMKLLAKEREGRTQSAEETLAALEGVLAFL